MSDVFDEKLRREGSTLVSELEAWQGAYFRLRNEVLNVAGSLVAAPGLAQELRTICAADEPLRRDYLDRHRDDIVPDSGEAIEPWQPRTSS